MLEMFSCAKFFVFVFGSIEIENNEKDLNANHFWNKIKFKEEEKRENWTEYSQRSCVLCLKRFQFCMSLEGEKDLLCLPSEFFLATAVSATESSDRLAFIGLPLLVTSEGASQNGGEEKFN